MLAGAQSGGRMPSAGQTPLRAWRATRVTAHDPRSALSANRGASRGSLRRTQPARSAERNRPAYVEADASGRAPASSSRASRSASAVRSRASSLRSSTETVFFTVPCASCS